MRLVRRSAAAALGWALAGCGDPAADGDGETTVMIASFGEDGPSGASLTDGTGTTTSATTTTATATTATTATTTDGPTTEPTTEPTTDTATDATADGTSTTTDPTDSTDATTTDGESTGGQLPACASIEATIRDFVLAHVDMSAPTTGRVEPGLVLDTLGPDGKPVYNPEYAGPAVITGPESFAQWYVDVPEVNLSIAVTLDVFEESPGRTVFQDSTFFPIDAQGFGNEGEAHNYFFTTEVRTTLVYQGGEVMTFGGDDDVWVFLDGHLVADVGGKHSLQTVNVVLDDLGLIAGESYTLDIFHAERGIGDTQLRFELGAFCQV